METERSEFVPEKLPAMTWRSDAVAAVVAAEEEREEISSFKVL